jgi:hypothetical protein
MVSRIREAGQVLHVLNSPHARHSCFRSSIQTGNGGGRATIRSSKVVLLVARSSRELYLIVVVSRRRSTPFFSPGTSTEYASWPGQRWPGQIRVCPQLPSDQAIQLVWKVQSPGVRREPSAQGSGRLFTFTRVPDRFLRFVDRVLELKVTACSAPITARAFFGIFPDDRNF